MKEFRVPGSLAVVFEVLFTFKGSKKHRFHRQAVWRRRLPGADRQPSQTAIQIATPLKALHPRPETPRNLARVGFL